MKLGYITNGLAHHTLEDAIELLSELGYQALGLTLDVNHLDPRQATPGQIEQLRTRLEDSGMAVAIETGARFLLDPRRKHEPTLVSGEAQGRLNRLMFYQRAIEIGDALGAELISLWSGCPNRGTTEQQAWQFLIEGCQRVCEMADEHGMQVAFEPEPGMLVETIDQYLSLAEAVQRENFKLTIDIGHLACVEQAPLASHILRARDQLVHLHIDDIRDGRHLHLPFGEGEIDFPPIFDALRRIDYQGLLLVELSRDSHRAPEVARQAIASLEHWIQAASRFDSESM